MAGSTATSAGRLTTSGVELSPDSRVLLTGASGLIGRQVAALLHDRVELFCVSRQPQSGNGATWIAADLGTSGTARKLVEQVRPSVIIHLAGAVRGDRTLDAVLPTLRSNLVGTVELLDAAARADIARVVASGSLLEEPAGGDPSAIPPSPYGASRWASSMYARVFHLLFGTPVVVLRPSYAYGPGQTGKLIPHVISSALRGVSAELASGERRMDFVYAEDVGRAYVAALSAPGVEGEIIDIGCGELTRVRDVVDMVLDLVGPQRPSASYGAIDERPFEQEVQVDVDRARRLLGWIATTPLEEGLRRTVEWYVENGGGD
jgi:UDP-glucose 4-epimerase